MKCSVCSGEMKPLLLSWYCPQDCDKFSYTVESPVPEKRYPPAFVLWNENPPHPGTWVVLDDGRAILFPNSGSAVVFTRGFSNPAPYLVRVVGIDITVLPYAVGVPFGREAPRGSGLKGLVDGIYSL